MQRSYVLTDVEESHLKHILEGEDCYVFRKKYKTPKSLAHAIIRYYTPSIKSESFRLRGDET